VAELSLKDLPQKGTERFSKNRSSDGYQVGGISGNQVNRIWQTGGRTRHSERPGGAKNLCPGLRERDSSSLRSSE
jgi:hypothetical protein